MALIRHTTVVSLSTLLSRILGYVRDVLIAMNLGAGILNDLFILALRLPNLFRTIFGEGAFSSSFVPLFAKILNEEGKEQAKTFAQHVQSMLIIILIAFCLLLYLFMPQVVDLTAPGMVQNKEHYRLAVELSRITVPYLFLISLVAFYGGMLNAEHRYFAFAMAPILLNIVLIAASFWAQGELEVYILAYAISVGGWLELIWMLIFTWRAGLLWLPTWPQWTPQVRELFRRFGPCLLGAGVAQINVWVDTILASMLPNALSYLYYADRINQLPLALIGTALGTVLLPMLARHSRDKQGEKAVRLQNKALDLGLFLAIPAAIALHYMAPGVVKLLFQYGEFGELATNNTAAALAIFAYGLPAYVLVKIFIASFYAVGDTMTPAKIAAWCIIINMAISLSLMPYIAHLGIATAATVASWCNALALGIMLHKRGLAAVQLRNIVSIILYCICALAMGRMLLWVGHAYGHLGLLWEVSLQVLSGSIFYLAIAGVLRYMVRTG